MTQRYVLLAGMVFSALTLAGASSVWQGDAPPESASRTLKEPTPKRIQSLVHEISLKRLLDGQFDECNLKMNEIRVIEESLIKSLLAAHHGRVRYPGQRSA